MPGKYANRHGLIAGATGTGKTVSLANLAEQFSRAGVSVFLADVKGDLSGMAAAGDPATAGRATAHGAPWWPERNPVSLWDVFGRDGAQLSTSLDDMGADLAARALGLTDVQAGVLEIAYAVAADTGRPLHTLADLRDLCAYLADNRPRIGKRYGLVTPASLAAIGRAVLRLERGDGGRFFSSEPFDPLEFLSTAAGRGRVNILAAERLIQSPRLYAAFLLWFLATLYRRLPEVGDAPLPRLAFFIDEAHLIFADCPPELLRTIDQTVRLIRSKGVGVYFATQAPSDIPDAILRQLHLRIQHGLRAVTPADRGAVRAAADSLPPNPALKPAELIQKLGNGQALVSFLGQDGRPTPVVLCDMLAPRCRLGPLTADERRALIGPPAPPPMRNPSTGRAVPLEIPAPNPTRRARGVPSAPAMRRAEPEAAGMSVGTVVCLAAVLGFLAAAGYHALAGSWIIAAACLIAAYKSATLAPRMIGT